ncbi:hypothetical protein EBT31_04660 [bacterium]|nr:hypothetical protein [bacterium]
MRFFARILAVCIGAFMCIAPSFAFAAPQDQSFTDGYRDIMEQGIIFANICPDPAPESGEGDGCQCRAQGICSLAELVQIAVNIIILILGISGTVALLMFIYGGWNWVFAQGRPEYIQTGKDTMKHAIIGLAIIFGAYAMINFLIAVIGGVDPAATLEETIMDIKAKEGSDTYQINAGQVIDTNTQ